MCRDEWDKHKRMVWAMILKEAPEDDARDLLQDICLAFCKRLPKPPPIKDKRKFLARITRNKIVDYIKKRIREREHLEPVESYEQLQAGARDPDARIALEQLFRRVTDLNELEKRVLSLRHGYGLQYPDIGEALDITANHARKIKNKAAQKIEAFYDREGGEA
ncbi:MAG: sigma-70 family RNA polymerase sigma factor [Acidobacteriota bacterium]|nr:sigma-70 family RNA polymerase sigma factor [Acidobacteriota bacterium]